MIMIAAFGNKVNARFKPLGFVSEIKTWEREGNLSEEGWMLLASVGYGFAYSVSSSLCVLSDCSPA